MRAAELLASAEQCIALQASGLRQCAFPAPPSSCSYPGSLLPSHGGTAATVETDAVPSRSSTTRPHSWTRNEVVSTLLLVDDGEYASATTISDDGRRCSYRSTFAQSALSQLPLYAAAAAVAAAAACVGDIGPRRLARHSPVLLVVCCCCCCRCVDSTYNGDSVGGGNTPTTCSTAQPSPPVVSTGGDTAHARMPRASWCCC